MFKNSYLLTIPGVAVVTLLFLTVPLVAMQFTHEVTWTVGDFIVMGALLFCTGSAFVLLIRNAPNWINRLAFASAIGSTFLLIWANLAVGLIGGGPHAGNLMYIGVVAVVIIGTYISRFSPAGMEKVMFATAFALVMVTVIALLSGMHNYPGSSVGEIIRVNAFFAFLFAVSGVLFRYLALEQSNGKSVG